MSKRLSNLQDKTPRLLSKHGGSKYLLSPALGGKKVSQKEIVRLVAERLKALPSDRKIAIGNKKSMSRQTLIKHVKAQDKIGRLLVKAEMAYLQALKKGIFYER